MASPRWIGDAQAVADVWTITATGTWASGDTVTMTVGASPSTKIITVTYGNGVPTTTQVAAALKAAWEGDALTAYGETRTNTGPNIPEFTEATATTSTNTVTLTADTAGVPLTIAVSRTTSATGAIAIVNTTAATGPNFWSNAANWDTGAVPVSTDTPTIDGNVISSIKYGLAQSAVTLTSLTIDCPDSTFQIGLPEQNPLGYREYRATYLAISVTTLNVRSNSGLIRFNLGSVAGTVNVWKTGSRAEDGVPAFVFKGTSASNVLNARSGDIGVAIWDSETANLSGGVSIGYEDNADSDVTLKLGAGVTLGTVNKYGGNLETNSNVTTLLQLAGETVVMAGAVTTLTIRGGDVRYQSAGTLTTASVSGDGLLDFSRDPRAKTVTNPIDVYGTEADIYDPNKVVASLVVDYNEVEVKVNTGTLGRNVRVTRGTPA